MRRVMIIGQPGSGKSTLARHMGEITRLPVYHIDHIHWMPGWQEREAVEKAQLCADVHAKDEWVFEGGHSVTWPARLARADTLIWLDLPLWLRAWRVLWRTLRHWGRTRPDLPEGCPEQFSAEFWLWIWRTRRSARIRIQALYDGAPASKDRYHLRSRRDVARYLAALRVACAAGNLDRPHR